MAKFDIQIINILHVEFSLGQGYHMMDNLYIFADVACMEVLREEYNSQQSLCPRIAEGNVQSKYCQCAAQRINELL